MLTDTPTKKQQRSVHIAVQMAVRQKFYSGGPVQDKEQKYAFKSIKLLKEQALGTGVVFKAKCDQLICAAKLVYPVQASDNNVEQHIYQFESECQFLSRISHPNIVQYLGIYRDPETNTPVLLMELMDENLTHFLESSLGDIPYHIQVNLSYDIAQALAFLHSNGIIHCDLSSNNVLLIAGTRAKVTDFGMSKFTTVRTCPRKRVFMPPEVLNEPPVYTEKLDSFSFGVLLIQIATRQFPDPANRITKISQEALALEVERRQTHIHLIESTHPLLSITLDCLKDKDVDRPTTKQLCETVDVIKSTLRDSRPIVSPQQDTEIMQMKEEQLQLVDHELQALQEELKLVKQELSRLHIQLEFDEEMGTVSQKGNGSEHNERPNDLHHTKTHSELGQPQTELSVSLKWETLPDAPYTITKGSSTTIGTTIYMCGLSCTYVLSSSANQWRKLPAHPNIEYTVINIEGMLTTIGGRVHGWSTAEKKSNQLYCFINGKWGKQFPPMTTRRYAPAAVYSNFTLVVAGGTDNRNSNAVEVLSTPRKQWSTVSSLPFSMKQPSIAICGEHIYLHDNYSPKSVLKCSLFTLVQSRSSSDVWEKIASLPVSRSTLATINGLLLSVGGETSSNSRTKDIYLYNPGSNSWTVVSQMSTARSQCLTALLPDNKLMVVGGDPSRIEIELASIF